MPDKVVQFEDSQMPQWDDFVWSHPLGSIYHTSSWRRVISATYSSESRFFALVDEHDRILGVLPVMEIRDLLGRKRFSTLPCAQSCDPLVSSEEQYLMMRKAIISFAEKGGAKVWELKMSHLFPHNKRDGAFGVQFFTYVLELDRSIEAIFANLHTMLRRSISKASRSGLVLKCCNSLEEVGVFYDLYLRMRRQKGLLPQPRRFFEILWKEMDAERRIDIFYAEHKGKIISTAMILKYREKATYEYGATEQGGHRFSPSPFLLWEAIKRAKGEGYASFDFGRTAASETTLAAFKERWGSIQQPLFYHDYVNDKSSTALKHNWLAKSLMGIAMRSLPPSICELAGRKLYRYLL